LALGSVCACPSRYLYVWTRGKMSRIAIRHDITVAHVLYYPCISVCPSMMLNFPRRSIRYRSTLTAPSPLLLSPHRKHTPRPIGRSFSRPEILSFLLCTVSSFTASPEVKLYDTSNVPMEGSSSPLVHPFALLLLKFASFFFLTAKDYICCIIFFDYSLRLWHFSSNSIRLIRRTAGRSPFRIPSRRATFSSCATRSDLPARAPRHGGESGKRKKYFIH
jgi:hypothetical protein